MSIRRNFLGKKRAKSKEGRARKMASFIHSFFVILPWANRRFFFEGCCLSNSTSMMSLKMYMALAAREKEMKASRVDPKILTWRSCPAKKGTAKIRIFLNQWCSLRRFFRSSTLRFTNFPFITLSRSSKVFNNWLQGEKVWGSRFVWR